eukprot:GFYU01003644.1.p1 GENE.GFYU01003644.1~~GFYU01003644.1.p1  ORF type:complete len:434 (-),score=75.83 GFYU01003644.1:51-1352(-)
MGDDFETSGLEVRVDESARPLAVIKAHNRDCRGVSFSPDARMVVSVGTDNNAKIWNVESKKLVRVYQGHTKSIFCVAWSPVSNLLVSAGQETELHVWDVKTCKTLYKLKGHMDAVYTVAFSPKGDAIASGGVDRTVRIFNPNTGHIRATLHGHRNFVRSVVFDRKNPNLILSCSSDMTARLWDISKGGVLVHTLQGHQGSLYCGTIHPLKPFIYTGASDKEVRVWEQNSGKNLLVFKFHRATVNAICVTGADDIIISGSEDRMIAFWDAQTGNVNRVIKAHDELVWSMTISLDGRTLATGSADRTVKIWDTNLVAEVLPDPPALTLSDGNMSDVQKQMKGVSSELAKLKEKSSRYEDIIRRQHDAIAVGETFDAEKEQMRNELMDAQKLLETKDFEVDDLKNQVDNLEAEREQLMRQLEAMKVNEIKAEPPTK